MDRIEEQQFEINRLRFKSLYQNDILLRKVIRIAQYESEIDLGVNPYSLEQANTGILTEQDFEYIKRVCDLVEKRLKDSNWLINTLDLIDSKSEIKEVAIRGVKFDDELFKAGRGILESYINDRHQ